MLIPENGCYIQNGKEYKTGDKFPSAQTNDIYRLGDYEYCLNRKASLLSDNPWLSNPSQDGWGVRVLDKTKTTYGEILNEINGFKVVSLHNAFYECVNMVAAPSIPDTVVDLWGTFSCCSSLICSPIIPHSVQKMQWTFELCESLKEMPEIPQHIKDLSGSFADCISLQNISLPPQINTKIDKIFINCQDLINSLN